jgi:hypothetical protein
LNSSHRRRGEPIHRLVRYRFVGAGGDQPGQRRDSIGAIFASQFRASLHIWFTTFYDGRETSGIGES